MTYDAAVTYLYNLQKHGIKLGLETMTALIARLGRPAFVRGRQDDGRAAVVQLDEQLADLTDPARVEPVRRLVEHQQLRPA